MNLLKFKIVNPMEKTDHNHNQINILIIRYIKYIYSKIYDIFKYDQTFYIILVTKTRDNYIIIINFLI